jgi:acetyl-CoA carboxylase biotin carboxylase subunit
VQNCDLGNGFVQQTLHHQVYPLNATLYVGLDGVLTTKQPTENHPGVAVCTGPPSATIGTVEFLYDLDTQKFYFMEMNTRIQVEHPVTEGRTGIDLISEQIRHSQGEISRFKQSDIVFRNHVMEFRINAEDPRTGLPSPGYITHYHRPGGLGVRTDDYIYTGYTVPPHYDSMISKIIVHADNRLNCISRAKRVLRETVVSGIKTNIELHRQILDDPDFVENQFSTNYLAQKLI